MLARLKSIVRAARIALARSLRRPGVDPLSAEGTLRGVARARALLAGAAAAGVAGWLLCTHLPLRAVDAGEPGVRRATCRGQSAGCAACRSRRDADGAVPRVVRSGAAHPTAVGQRMQEHRA